MKGQYRSLTSLFRTLSKMSDLGVVWRERVRGRGKLGPGPERKISPLRQGRMAVIKKAESIRPS